VKIKKSNFKDEDFKRSERYVDRRDTNNLKHKNYRRLKNEDKSYKIKEY
jgi:hypothetical protein